METPSKCLDLYEFMNEKGCPSEGRACKFIYKVLKTVIGCYHLGVIHRDIKPENILVNLDNLELTLIDFGGGSLVKRATYNEKVGSDEFYPPEWHKNRKYHAEPLTVWSLGITLYYMVWGDVPFKTIDDICNAEVKFPIEISSNCKKIIRKCLNKNPNERASLLDIFDDLEDCIGQKMSNNTRSNVSPKNKSMASTSNSSNDSSSTNSEFRRVTEELIEDNFFNVNAATKKRKYEKPQILTDDSVSKKVKYEFDTEHQTEDESGESDIDTGAETEYESDECVIDTDAEVEKESEEPIIDSIQNYQFGTEYEKPQILTDDSVSKKVKYEFNTEHQTENELDESDIDTGAETEYESDSSVVDIDAEIEKETEEPIIDGIDKFQFGTEDEFEDQSQILTDDGVSKKVKNEFDTEHQTENESDECDVDIGVETKYESNESVVDTDAEIEKESEEPIIDSIDNYQFGTDDEFEDQSDSDTDDEIDLDKNFIDVAADTG